MHDRSSRLLGFGATVAYLVAAALFALILTRHDTSVTVPVQIEAPPAAVWRALADNRNYPAWNPLIRRLEGELTQGGEVDLTVRLPGAASHSIRASVLVANADGELRWKGAWLHPDLLLVEDSVEFEKSPTGTKLNHTARFTGLLAGRFTVDLIERGRVGLEAMNQALKEYLEQPARSTAAAQ